MKKFLNNVVNALRPKGGYADALAAANAEYLRIIPGAAPSGSLLLLEEALQKHGIVAHRDSGIRGAWEFVEQLRATEPLAENKTSALSTAASAPISSVPAVPKVAIAATTASTAKPTPVAAASKANERPPAADPAAAADARRLIEDLRFEREAERRWDIIKKYVARFRLVDAFLEALEETELVRLHQESRDADRLVIQSFCMRRLNQTRN